MSAQIEDELEQQISTESLPVYVLPEGLEIRGEYAENSDSEDEKEFIPLFKAGQAAASAIMQNQDQILENVHRGEESDYDHDSDTHALQAGSEVLAASDVMVSRPFERYLVMLYIWARKHSVSNEALHILLRIIWLIVQLALLPTRLHGFSDDELPDELLKSDPPSIYSLQKRVEPAMNHWNKFVFCKSCGKVWDYETLCVTSSCSATRSINLQPPPLRICCNVPLISIKRRKRDGAYIQKPLSTNVCILADPEPWLQKLFSQNWFVETVEHDQSNRDVERRTSLYRPYDESANNLSGNDIGWSGAMDSARFKNFRVAADSRATFKNGLIIGLSINIDGFQLYDQGGHSCLMLYMACMNLPRDQRFLPGNFHVIGAIAGIGSRNTHIVQFYLLYMSIFNFFTLSSNSFRHVCVSIIYLYMFQSQDRLNRNCFSLTS